MKVIEHIQQAKDTLVSFEILRPLKGRTINSIYEHLDPLMAFNPSFINVTYHRSETMFKKKSDGTFEKVDLSMHQRPDDPEIARLCQSKLCSRPFHYCSLTIHLLTLHQ